MKKYLVSIGVVSLLALSACGTDSASEAEEEDTGTTEEQEEETEEETENNSDEEDGQEDESDEPDDEAEEVATTDGGHSVGETVSDENGEQTLVSLNDDIDTVESGPIILDIEKVNGVSAVFEGMAAEMLDDPEVEYIQVDMNVENTSEEDITFYAGQGTLITDTGEQLDRPEMLLSDHIGGDFLGEVTKSGSMFYILENSNAEDVTSVELRFSAPSDSDTWDDVGEDIQVEIDLQ